MIWQDNGIYVWHDRADYIWHNQTWEAVTVTDPIRERIIQAVIAKLGRIQTANGFNSDLGAYIQRAMRHMAPDHAVQGSAFPRAEGKGRPIRKQYGSTLLTMPMDIDAVLRHGDGNPSELSEPILADMIEAMIGKRFMGRFDHGTMEIVAGDTIEGSTSGATSLVETMTLLGGSWNDGSAAGTLILRRMVGAFTDRENLIVDAAPVAVMDARPAYTDPVTTTTNGLADRIDYIRGGVTDYPESDEQSTGVLSQWRIQYRLKHGDPWHQ